jgi:hypothetical protein
LQWLFQLAVFEFRDGDKLPRFLASLLSAIWLEEKYSVKITFPRQSPENGEGRTREQLKSDEVSEGKNGVANANRNSLWWVSLSYRDAVTDISLYRLWSLKKGPTMFSDLLFQHA